MITNFFKRGNVKREEDDDLEEDKGEEEDVAEEKAGDTHKEDKVE